MDSKQDKIYRAGVRSIINNKGGKDKLNDQRRVKMCLSKVGYDIEFEAEVAAAKRGQRAYKCQYCPHYHLASK